MKKIHQRKILPVLILVSITLSPLYGDKYILANDPGPFFSISMLIPQSGGPAIYQWTYGIEEDLLKIGIAVDVMDASGWAQISPRTWSYPGPYPVPPYSEGGFDVLFVGWSWGLNWNPIGLYDTRAITPNGDNHYQYSSVAMDNVLAKYNASFLPGPRIAYAEEIQAILYEDNPCISIYYPYSVYPHHEDLANFEGLLWAEGYYPFHRISINDKTDFHYATPADFEDFHIHTYESVYDAQWLSQIYTALVQRNPTLLNLYSNWLAESFSSVDGINYQVTIKDDACWADGTNLTTDDIIYNYQLAVTRALGGTGYSKNILYWDNDSITKINDKKFDIAFLKHYNFQTSNLALELIPKHIWGTIDLADHQTQAVNWSKNYPEKMFGAGPFKLEEYNPSLGFIHLVKNSNFSKWSGIEPNFEDIYFEFYTSKESALAALAAGSIDMVDAQFSPKLDELSIPGTNYTLVDDPGVAEMGFNMAHPYLGTGTSCPIAGSESARYIRKAISHIIHREMIVESYLNGLGRPGITCCPSVAIGFDESLDPYNYSLFTALDYMTMAGFEVISPNNSFIVGISVPIFLAIFALIGSTIILVSKRRN